MCRQMHTMHKIIPCISLETQNNLCRAIFAGLLINAISILRVIPLKKLLKNNIKDKKNKEKLTKKWKINIYIVYGHIFEVVCSNFTCGP